MDLTRHDFSHNGPAELNGEWEFHWEKLHSDLTLSAAEKSSLKYQNVPGNWAHSDATSGYPSFGYATYRLTLVLSPDPGELSFAMKTAATAYSMRVNGVEILSNGKVGRNSEDTVPEYQPLVSKAVLLKEHNEILVEVANFSHSKAGLWDIVQIGKESELSAKEQWSNVISFFIAGSMIIMSIYHFSFFILRRKDSSSFFFAFMCLFIALRIFFVENQSIHILPFIGWENQVKLSYLSTDLFSIFFISFMYTLFPDEITKTAVFLVVCSSLILSIVVAFSSVLFFSQTHFVYNTIYAITVIWTLSALFKAVIKKRDYAITTLAGTIILFSLSINDVLYSLMIINSVYLIPAGSFIYNFMFSVVIAGRLARSFTNVELLTIELTARTDELIEKNMQLKSLDSIKDEFLANTSHELKTPLQGIIGIADSLVKGSAGLLSENVNHQLEMIKISGKRLSNLVNDILDFSKLQNKDIALNKKAVDIYQLSSFIIETNMVQAKSKNIEIRNQISSDFPLLHGDEDRIMQIMQNLIGNSIKFTERGSVVISAKKKGTFGEICVRDTGIGIPHHFHNKIFDSFEQLDTKKAGSGLGLAITRSLVELHGGIIWLNTENNAGAEFHFTLPISTQMLAVNNIFKTARNNISAENSIINESGSSIVRSNDNRNVNILIVDDELINVQIFTNYLSLAGLETKYSLSGEEALQMIRNNEIFDLIILDHMMPNMSGLEVAKEIRKIYSPLELPILILTAKSQEDDFFNALNLGANDFLGKPVEYEHFIMRVNNLLNIASTNRNLVKIKKENTEAIKKIREKINIDLHDHLGGQLTDLKFLTEELSRDHDNQELIDKLNQQVNKTISMLRQQMLDIEDWEILSEDFLKGIHLAMLRRYSGSSREFDFHVTEAAGEFFKQHKNENNLIELYGMINEIITNDLKYGSEISSWAISFEDKTVRIFMTTNSSFRLQERKNGRGTGNLTYRIAKLNGKLEMGLYLKRYQLKIFIPQETFL